MTLRDRGLIRSKVGDYLLFLAPSRVALGMAVAHSRMRNWRRTLNILGTSSCGVMFDKRTEMSFLKSVHRYLGKKL